MLDRAIHRLSPSALRTWYAVHKWTSLVSTLFLLLLCVTDLPLLFYEEIDRALGYSIDAPERPGVQAQAPLDEIVDAARARQPGHVVQFPSLDQHSPGAWFGALGETASSPEISASLMFDARTGEFLHAYPLDQGLSLRFAALRALRADLLARSA